MAGKPRAKAAEAAEEAELPSAEPEAVQPAVRSKKGIPFNPDEDYATIHGAPSKARFLQDGRYYDSKFNPCEF